jgi:hypothetical protein
MFAFFCNVYKYLPVGPVNALAITVLGHSFYNQTYEIKIGISTFTKTLYDNATATTFKSVLPTILNISELNGNEKFADLSKSLPAKASNRELFTTAI